MHHPQRAAHFPDARDHSPAKSNVPNEPNPISAQLPARVAATIQRYRMFDPGHRVGVAVSGGADSVCLLHTLMALAPELPLHLTVLHLNHQLRGEESQQDEQFVRDLAARLNLPAIIQSVDVAASPDNLEQAARNARISFFHQQLASDIVDRIAVGHTRNDQAETVLFRFLRGSGGAGLAAIRPVTRDRLVRPLINIGRSDIELYLRERGIAWREDSSNASTRFARNRIRHQLLPQIARDWNPAIHDTLNRTADWALAEDEYWQAEIERLSAGRLTEYDGAILLPVDWLCDLPLAVARRIVRRAIERAKGDLRGVGFDHVAAILELGSFRNGHGRLQVPDLEVTRSFNWLRFATPPAAATGFRLPVSVPGTVPLPGTQTALSLELIENPETIAPQDCVYNEGTSYVDWRSLSGPLEVRSWRPGDRYQPSGSTGEDKIKTLFQKARIPRWERGQWPVMIDGSSIVWTRQFGPALRFAAGAGSAVVLRIREVKSP